MAEVSDPGEPISASPGHSFSAEPQHGRAPRLGRGMSGGTRVFSCDGGPETSA